MWAETPDYLSIHKDSLVTMEDELRVVYDINPEMYAETPGLNETLPRPQPETIDSILLAKEKWTIGLMQVKTLL